MAKSMGMVCCVALLLGVCGAASAAPSAGGVIAPPVSGKAHFEQLNPIPPEKVGEYLEHVADYLVFDAFSGMNEALAARAAGSTPMMAGANLDVDLWSADLFRAGFSEDGARLYAAGIASEDARGLRLRVELDRLGQGDDLWVLDPAAVRAFGPWSASDHVPGGTWLNLVEGGTAVLLLRTGTDHVPVVRVTGLSHIFLEIRHAFTKQLSCNINIACEEDPDIQDLSSGVGRAVISASNGTFLCSGVLVNNPDTPELEPYFLTANHCVANGSSAANTEIFWDYRSTLCDANDSSLAGLPRSQGLQMLATNSPLDITLIELVSVPGGPYGRAYAGWTLDTPTAGQNLVGIHHPQGSHMRISYGTVTNPDQSGGGFLNQIAVHWPMGVTEPGSSGSGLFDRTTLQLLGVLSNGPLHSCTNTVNNRDNYASFRHFFPQIEEFLTGPEAPVIELSPTMLAFGASGGVYTVEVSNAGGGTLDWDVSVIEGADWLSAERVLEKDGSGAFTVTAQESPTEESREGLVRVTAPDAANSPVDLPVTQGIPVPGDLNGDGAVNALDVQLVINGALGIDIAPHDGDVNCDGAVNALDVQLVINAALGIEIGPFPDCNGNGGE